MEKLSRVKKGQAPTVSKADEMNKIIDAINYLMGTEVQPPTVGKFKDSTAHRVLDLTGLETYISDRVDDALNKMSVTAVCNGDGTITINVSYTGA